MAQHPAQGIFARSAGRIGAAARGIDYRRRSLTEHLRFLKCPAVHALPEIFHYWSNRYLRPKLTPLPRKLAAERYDNVSP